MRRQAERNRTSAITLWMVPTSSTSGDETGSPIVRLVSRQVRERAWCELEIRLTSQGCPSGAEPLVVHARDAHEQGVFFGGLIVIQPLEGREGFVAEALFAGGSFLDGVLVFFAVSRPTKFREDFLCEHFGCVCRLCCAVFLSRRNKFRFQP